MLLLVNLMKVLILRGNGREVKTNLTLPKPEVTSRKVYIIIKASIFRSNKKIKTLSSSH